MQNPTIKCFIEPGSGNDRPSCLPLTLRNRILVCFLGFFIFSDCMCTAGFATEILNKPAVSQPVIDMESVPDEKLEDRIRAILSHVEDFKNVKVTVSDGVVRLNGEIARAEAKEKLEKLVSRFRGVLYVENRIKTATDVEARVVPVLDRLRDYANRIRAQLSLIIVSLAVAALFWLIGRLVSRIAPRYGWFGINPMMKGLMSRLLMFVFFVAGIIIALDILDITSLVGAVIGTAGIAGLAIGFAFKDIVENYLAGLLLSIRALFAINDHVVIGDIEGRVIRLTSREIVLMTLDGNHVLIPNSTVFKSVIVNFTRNRLRRLDFVIGVGLSEDLDNVRRVGRETLRAMKGIVDDPDPFMRIEDLGDFAVKMRFLAWIDQRDTDFFKARSEAIRLVKEAFDEAGIEMPFPTHVQYEYPRAEPPEEEVSSDIGAKPALEVEAATADVSVDTQLNRQIEEDLKTSEEDNYLKKEAPQN